MKFRKIPVKKDSFVGMKIENQEVLLFHPCELEFNDDIKFDRKRIYNFLKTIEIGKKFLDQNNNNAERTPIDSMHWLINDYIENGFARESTKNITKNSKGKISWKNTLRRILLIVNNGFLFRDIYYIRTLNIDDELLSIYKFCLDKAILYFGWLYGIDEKFDIHLNVVHSIAFIKKILINTFNDNKKTRLNHILNILSFNEKGIGSKVIEYGVETYHSIFELMLRYLIQNEDIDEALFYPRGEWHIDDNVSLKESLRPDFVFEDTSDPSSKRLYVFDAKFYRSNYPNIDVSKLPSSTNIQKQINYGTYVNNTFNYDDIYNAFILPNAKGDFLIRIGKARMENDTSTATYHDIVAILIDLNELIERFIGFKKIKKDEFEHFFN